MSSTVDKPIEYETKNNIEHESTSSRTHNYYAPEGGKKKLEKRNIHLIL